MRRIWRHRALRALLLVFVLVVAVPGGWMGAKLIKLPNAGRWVPGYAADWLAGRYRPKPAPRHLFLIFCDHWEPGSGPAGVERAARWLQRIEPLARRHLDSQGRCFQYTWFYPLDNRQPEILADLSAAVGRGLGEVEVHWHHHHDASAAFEADLQAGLSDFAAAGALVDTAGAAPRFAFIHGNWALDNGGAPRHCGIDDEISILLRNGCYADLTFPALGSAAQPRIVNRIYRCQDTPAPRSQDHGVPARVGDRQDGLLLIEGPLGFDLRRPLQLIENGAIDDAAATGLVGRLDPPRSYRDYFRRSRVAVWLSCGIGVEGRPDWVFVKLHTHGIPGADALFGGELDAMLEAVEDACRERAIALHFVTAREAYNLVVAAERGLQGPPRQFYDLVVPPPLNRRAGATAAPAAPAVP